MFPRISHLIYVVCFALVVDGASHVFPYQLAGPHGGVHHNQDGAHHSQEDAHQAGDRAHQGQNGVHQHRGDLAVVEILKHPTKKDVHVVVAKGTDGQSKVVKIVYDRNGRVIDCDVNVDPEAALNLANEMKTNSQSNLVTMDVEGESEHCQGFLRARMEENMVQRQREPVPIEMEMEEEENGMKHRQKRGYLIWPGTNWCGKGSKAEFAESYGENVETDKCCQKHDQCPYIIEGFTTKYNLFNYRIHTLSICDCDEKFLNCLKSANTSTSTMVGKVYFNVVNTECFDLKLQKTCARRSWWGGCEKYATKWGATVRALGKYTE